MKAEQVKATRKPLVKLEVASYGHPAAVAATELQWQDFVWERFTALGDSTVPTYHGLAVPGTARFAVSAMLPAFFIISGLRRRRAVPIGQPGRI